MAIRNYMMIGISLIHLVVAEIIKGNGGPMATAVAAAVLSGTLVLTVAGAHALPTGGQVTAGQAAISTPNATQMNIKQGTNQAIINWNSFGIGKGETVSIAQPTSQSTLLNRVLGNDPSSIYGSLTANGRVFLVNPAGVLFAPGSSVNVGGLVASSLNIKDNDFLAGKYSFFKDGTAGSVVNQGNLTGGFVALLGNTVENAGTIVTTKGTTGLAAGDEITLGFDPNGLMAIKVDKAAYQAQVTNSGVIEADGGTVVMTASAADALLATVVNNSGTVRASSMVERNGEIVIEANTVTNSGTLVTSGVKGGAITLSGDHLTLANGSVLDASGETGGGTVLVGGDWQGSGAMHQATTVTMEQGAKIDVSATKNGDGGTAVLWSDIHKADSKTSVHGEILAKGGAERGDGGRVETSGHAVDVSGIRLSMDSPRGNTGEWLLDPVNINIDSTLASSITTALGSGNVSITTAGSNTPSTASGESGTDGDITIAAPISWGTGGTAGRLLTLTAARYINVNNLMTVSGTGSLTMNTGGIGYVKTLQSGNDTFTGKVNFTGTGTLTINSDTYTVAAGTVVNTTAALQSVSGSTKYVLGSDRAAGAWTPLTPGTGFSGTLDGLGHTISSMQNSTSTSDVGLFGTTSGATIQNLGMTGLWVIAGADNVGAFVGRITGGTNRIRNAFTSGSGLLPDASAATKNYIGGFVGRFAAGSLTIEDSYNNASIHQNNSGTTYKLQNVGGFVGYSAGDLTLTNLVNKADIRSGDTYATAAQLGLYVGGFLGGREIGTLTISGGYNSGQITGGDNTGGIVGYSYLDANTSITSVGNKGAVTGGTPTGGIVGRLTQSSGTLTLDGLYNQAAVSGTSTTGGLIGTLQVQPTSSDYTLTISNSYNSATVAASGNYVGGLVGVGGFTNGNPPYHTTLNITNTYNSGNVSGVTNVGGLFGQTSGPKAVNVTESYTSGTISASVSAVGALVGDAYSSAGQPSPLVMNQFYYLNNVLKQAGVTKNQINGADGFTSMTGTYGVKTTAELQSISGLGFTSSTWSQSSGANGGYSEW